MSGDALRRLIVAAGAAAAVGGCGLGPGDEPDSPVSLMVTRDFGTRPVLQKAAAEVSGADTIMRVTQRNAKVTTRFGGDFVHAISGVSGGQAAGRPVDWFIYLNGILTDKGAGGLRVSGGDRIWWDHHEWGLTPDVPAVVGAFPEPFRHGIGGKRPVKLQCELPRSPACETVARALAQHDVATERSGLGSTRRDAAPRIFVGAWKALRDGPEARSIEQGPKSSGVFARFATDGARLDVLDGRGAVAKRLTAEAGLVAATRRPGGPPVWFVTGTDGSGVAAASRMFDERTLRSRFAIAASGDARLSVPLTVAGEG